MIDVLTSLTGENQLITVSEACDELKITSSASITAFLSFIIGEVSSTYESECNTVLRSQSLSGIYDGDGTNELLLRNSPIVSIESVFIRNSFSDSWTDITSDVDTSTDDYKIILKTKTFPKGRRTVKTSYTAGYSFSDKRLQPLKLICKEDVAVAYKDSKDDRLGKTSTTFTGNSGAGTISFKSLSEEHIKVLNKFKRLI
jgi:hypothetical protein